MAFTLVAGIGTAFAEYFRLHAEQGRELFGGFTMSEQEVAEELNAPGFNPDTMITRALCDEDGSTIGFAEVRAHHEPPVRLYGHGYVAVGARGLGVGTALVAANERMAELYLPRCPDEARVVLQQFSPLAEARTLLENHGYTHTRDSLVMRIALGPEVAPPAWPEGATIRTLADGLSLDTFARVHQESFSDHRGAVRQELSYVIARWNHMIEAASRVYDPRLFVMVSIADTPAGIVAMWTEDEDDAEDAYVQVVGVVPGFRRRGLGEALLRHAFGEARRLGKRGVALSVDGSSLTGADRLYRRAGMYEKQRIAVFEKEIRAGIEISKQN